MTEPAPFLLSLGSILLIGLATDAIGRLTPLPRVTLLLLFGVGIGPAGWDLLPAAFVDEFDLVATLALVMVGFLLGGQLTLVALRRHGREILWISIVVVVATSLAVFTALFPFGASLELALLLAGISSATDPAATVDVVHEVNAKGPFARTLLGIVAVDDAWGLIVFSLCVAIAVALAGGEDAASPLQTAAWEIGGAVLLGLILGLPVAQLTGRIEPGEPTLAEALGIVFLCGGLAIWLEVSYLIASMVLGMVVVNLARHHERPFHAIENIEWPFMVLFFILAGASLDVEALVAIGPIAGVYIASRGAGRVLGGWIGGRLCRTTLAVRRWIGLALMPQAGVALGMALVASSRLPEYRETLLPVAIGSTVVFELTGPVLTRYALYRAGEASSPSADA